MAVRIIPDSPFQTASTTSNSRLLVFPLKEVWSLIQNAGHVGNCLNKEFCFYPVTLQLNDRIQTITSNSPIDLILKKIWNQFFTGKIQPNEFYFHIGAYFPRHGLFACTDLSQNEVSNDLIKIFEEFWKVIVIKSGDKERIHSDIVRILSRPTGKKLIQRILCYFISPKSIWFNKKIYVQESESFELNVALNCNYFLLEYLRSNFDSVTNILPNGKLALLKNPSWICLAHELFHLLDVLEYEARHLPNADFFEYMDTNSRETRVIHGTCGCHPKTDLCENELRKEFSLLQRLCHGSPINFISFANFGMVEKLQPLIEQGAVSAETFHTTLTSVIRTSSHSRFPYPRDSIPTLLELGFKFGFFENAPQSNSDSTQLSNTLQIEFPLPTGTLIPAFPGLEPASQSSSSFSSSILGLEEDSKESEWQ